MLVKFRVAILNFSFCKVATRIIIKNFFLSRARSIPNIDKYAFRVDVGEEILQKAMSETVNEPFSDVVAKLLMKRCLFKVLMKHHFSNQENRGSEGLLNQ